ncbi:MAG TPA: PAS domain S-box protein, partial [Flavisolibacter sp.]|nr:PAS domain S-box protein [Flavisolibacter sp.]
ISFDIEGKPVRFTGISQEITKQKEILASLQLQSLVLERMDEGVSVSDENGIILLTNSAEDEMFGYAAGELIGKHVKLQNAYGPGENERIVNAVITELKQKGFWSGQWHNRKKDGTHFYTHSFITSLAVDGKTFFVCVQRDITEERAAEEKLAYRTALLEAQNEAIPDAILIVDTKGKMLSFNHHFVTLWKIPQETIERKDDAAALEFAMTQLTDPQGFIERVNYCYAHPEEKAHEEVLFKDGRIIERYGHAVLGDDGKSYGWAWYFRDITERKRAEEKVKESEERFRSIADESPMFVFIIEPNAEATISYWNKTWLTYTSQSAGEALGRTWDGIIHPEDVPAVLKFYVPQFEKQEAYIIPSVRVKRYDGEYRWHTFKGTPRYLADGGFNGYVGVGFDIHEQKLAEEALKESEERFRSLGNSIPQLAWMADAEGSVYWYNQRWYDYTGTNLQEMQGWGWQAVHHPDLVERVKRDFANAIAKGIPYDDTFLLRSKEGEYRWFLTRAVPIHNTVGQIIQWFGTNTDVSAQRETEEALKVAKEQLELTFRNVPSSIYHFDKHGNILYLNERGAHQMGYATVADVMAEKDFFNFRKNLDKNFTVLDEEGKPLPVDQSSAALTFRTGKASEAVSQFIHRETGTSFWLLSRSEPLYNENGELTIVLTTSTDITLQKTSEQAIRQSEEKFRTLAETLPQLIWMTNEKGTQEYASSRWKEYTGVEPAGAESWQQMVHPDDMAIIMKAWVDSRTDGTIYRSEARLKNKTGEYRWHFVQGEPIRNEKGEIVKWIGAFTDIHEQKTIEEKLEKLVIDRTKELERSNEDLQQFAHVASHDLKEPVRKVQTFGSRLEQEFREQLPERAKLYLNKIQNAADRMFGLIDGVLNYSTINSLESSI